MKRKTLSVQSINCCIFFFLFFFSWQSKRYFADGHTKSRPAGRPPFSLTPWSTESTKGKDTKEMKAAGGISSDAGEDVLTLSISGFEFLCFAKLHRLLQSTSWNKKREKEIERKEWKIYFLRVWWTPSQLQQQQHKNGIVMKHCRRKTVADVSVIITNNAAHIIATNEDNIDQTGLLISLFYSLSMCTDKACVLEFPLEHFLIVCV